MFVILMCSTIACFALMVICAAVTPLRSRYSLYERTRRQKAGDVDIVRELRREETADDISGILRVIGALVLVLFVLLAMTTFGWLFGSLVAVAGVLLYGPLARFQPVSDASQHLYERFEAPVIEFVSQHHGVCKFFRSVPRDRQRSVPIASRDELLHMVEHIPELLTRDEQRLIRHGLEFSSVTVESIMTPRSVMDVVKKEDVLGPLLIDELHKTGHSRFPVVEDDVDHVIGVLYIHNLLQLHDKKTHKASSLMTTPVYYINQDQTLDHALAAFLRTHHHLFIVVNEYRETVGLLTLEDTLEALLGRKIVDEFDAHDDLRAVAARNPRGNNEPAKHTNV